MKLYNVGADLSKKTIDFVIHQLKVFLKVDNNISGFKELIKWFLQHGIDLSEVMIVMEHTGLYSYYIKMAFHLPKYLLWPSRDHWAWRAARAMRSMLAGLPGMPLKNKIA